MHQPTVRCLLSAAIILLSLFTVLLCETAYADFSIRPSITVSEEYDDNIFESPQKKTDYITRFMPGLSFSYSAPFWDWDLAYNYDYRYYARNTRNGDDTHNLLTKGLVRVIDDFLLLDISDTYSRVSLNIARDRTQESLFVNQSDSNNFTASPYLQFHPSRQTTIKTGYRYNNLWYRDPTAIDHRDHIGYIDVAYEYSPKLTLVANNTYTHDSSSEAYNRDIAYIGGKYEYSEKSFINAQGGMIFQNAQKRGNNYNKPYWNAVITHAFNMLTVSLSTGVKFPDDPENGVTMETDYALAVTKELRRGNIGLNVSYTEYSGSGIRLDVDKRYSAGITSRYELTTKLYGSLICSVERYDHQLANSYTRRILVNPSLNYTLPDEFSIGLNYTFVDSYSPEIQSDRYQVNRVSFELRKSFGKEVERFKTEKSPQ